ncbi:uncharacterized protein [Amphiura filiformis]|uniref:uncharacterized protein n=1 Tax=Amphiura filiformis TaxID=82378 RepID=UPI003B21C47D
MSNCFSLTITRKATSRMVRLVIPRLLVVMIIITIKFDISYCASSYLQPSHSSGFTPKRQHIRTSLSVVDRYEEINTGRVNLDTYVSTSSRYHGPSLEDNEDDIVGIQGGRHRRDVSLPDGSVFDTFNLYIPFGKIEAIPIATFTNGDFDFDSGVFTAPYSGAFFFLFHGPYGNEPALISVFLSSDTVDGINRTHAELAVSSGVSGVLPVVLPLQSGDTAYVELENYPRERAKFSAVFNVFDLYHFNVPPTQQYFTPYRIRQSAFTAIWKEELPPTDREEFKFQGYYNLTINLGSNFDVATGIFTAQFHGLHAFFLSFRVFMPPGATTISVRRNDVEIVSVGATASNIDVMERASTAFVIALQAGDEIQLVKSAFTPAAYGVGDAAIAFTGFLL